MPPPQQPDQVRYVLDDRCDVCRLLMKIKAEAEYIYNEILLVCFICVINKFSQY